MKYFKNYLLVASIMLFVGLIIYSDASAIGKIKILEIGPSKVKAGIGFNLQPNGKSAIWVKTENATKDTAIFWADSKLQTTYSTPNLLTAFVPDKLFSKPGKFKIYLVDQKNKQKSNSITLIVQ